jgi:hypothetical protein
MGPQQGAEPRALVGLDRLEGERERFALVAQGRDVVRQCRERLEAVLARDDQFGIGLRELGRTDIGLGGPRITGVKQRIAFRSPVANTLSIPAARSR